ncbi:hypothetical protein PZ61_0237980 [Streptomyces sp. MNU77]|uniref:hypothetical protein n=1 Tax=Streptomyces sp. MNU77 TaxID=1573406 RepID=UPI00094B81FA|nr:hypothetical protein [Streptomyces sp. MNU77]OLO25477.1 hypothetical protein PZ61_0237980 [Streptomyces sp. MNU77]
MTRYASPGRDDVLAPAVVLEFSDDLRSADVGPLQDFLAARLGEIARAQPEGTDARWAAEHLARTIDADCRDLDDALVSWEVELTEGDINQVGLVQTLRQSLPTGTGSWRSLSASSTTPTTFPADATCTTAAPNTPSSWSSAPATRAAAAFRTSPPRVRQQTKDQMDRSAQG